MNRSTRAVPGVTTVRAAVLDARVAPAAHLAGLGLAAQAAARAAEADRASAPIGDPPRPGAAPYGLLAAGPACPPID